MAERRSVEISLDAKQKMANLKVIASLNAANKLGQATIKIVVRNV
jgi:hypothetical protein